MPKKIHEHFQLRNRVQVLWEMQDPLTDSCELVYFSATIKEAREDGIFVLAYDGIKDYTEAQDDQVKLVDHQTLYSITEASNQKWRREDPVKKNITELRDRDAFCPLGHVLSRDLSNESIRICDCCLTGYYTTTGQWECKAASTCQDWGVCDNCLDDYLKTGAWSSPEEDRIISLREYVTDIEDDAVAEAEQLMKQLPFLMQSNIAHGYRQFVDNFTHGLREIYRQKGPDHVITEQDIRNITSNFARNNN